MELLLTLEETNGHYFYRSLGLIGCISCRILFFYAQNIKKNKQDAESLFNEAENKANEVMANAKREAESLKMELKPSKEKPVTPS